MAEITDTGYVLKNQNDWYSEEEEMYLEIDPDWNLDASSPDGLKLSSDSEIFANLDELGQKAYNSKDPNKATGIDLNMICAFTNTFRSDGSESNVTLTLNGVVGTFIEAGKLVESTYDSSQWSIDNDITLTGLPVTVNATCTEKGATSASVGTLTRIVKTVGGWQSVTNDTIATLGEDEQTNASLRKERKLSVSSPSTNQVDSMLGDLYSVDSVRKVIVPENDTKTDNYYGNGLPANSIAPIVDGGSDDDIALAIFRNKNPGCKLFAAGTSVTVADVWDKYESNKKDITFSRPIYVDMTVTVAINDDGTLPNDAAQEIKEAIIEYATGELDGTVGFNVSGFDIGENVPVSRLNTPINKVIGSYGNSYIGGLTINGQSFGQSVTIPINSLSRWDDSLITVSIS